jgi:dihydroorotate dehydrogenase (fumarate)
MLKSIEATMNAVYIPVAVKLPGRLTSPEKIVDELVSMGVSGAVLFNRFAGLDIDIENEKPIMHGGAAGHGGPFSIHYPLLWVSRLSTHKRIDIAASGGVTSAEDVVKYLLAGAAVVQVCTAIYLNGYEIAGKFIAGLKAWMDDKGYPNIASFQAHVSGDAVAGVHDVIRTKSVHFRIDADACTSCDLCRLRCLHDAVSNDDGVYTIVDTECVSCGLCAEICPSGAVHMYPVERS